MNDQIAQPAPAFGGRWTEEKLTILERYLDAYTTALRDKPFSLWYIDAFAGTGRVELSADDQRDIRRFVSGSAERAINIKDKSFDKLIFVEQDPDRCVELTKLQEGDRDRDIVIENSDANEFLTTLSGDWRGRRGVLFLDPYATQVEWSTLERIATFQALDTWILFPVGAISRMLPRLRHPEEVDEKWALRLNIIYGDESWRALYQARRQPDMFLADAQEREPGIDGLLSIYKSKLAAVFGDRFLHRSRKFSNSKNSPLFEFLFCVGNDRGIEPAKRIAQHILEHL